MNSEQLKNRISGIDIYLLDQFVKGAFEPEHAILDAGCGSGRNLKLFDSSYHAVNACDMDATRLEESRLNYPYVQHTVADLTSLPYSNQQFDRIICNAVLHFANSKRQFFSMFEELVRVLKPKGLLFIRMTSDIGIESLVKSTGDGTYQLPDNTFRFLMTNDLLEKLLQIHDLNMKEPLKSVNVSNLRSMSTIVLEKA